MASASLTIVVMVVVQLLLPGYLIYDIARERSETRVAWCLRALAAAAYIALAFVAGRWDVVSYYLRLLLPIAFTIAAAAGFVRLHPAAPVGKGRFGRLATRIGNVASVLLFAGLLLSAMRGYRYDDTPLPLSSPLRGGTFYVGQGGNSPLINYHNTHATQRFAVDIVELNAIGTRATSFQPRALDDYVIFGRQVHSPCSGHVAAVVDGFDDNLPPQSDSDNPAGNHVIVDCEGVRVLLAHLQRGSVAVRQAAAVASGDVIARVGNSGNTSEPHLHVHAVRGSSSDAPGAEVPVPIAFDGTFPVRNTILRGSRDVDDAGR